MHSTPQTARAALETFNETASTGDAWIRQRKLPIGPQKSSTKLLQLVTHAFDSANSPCMPEKSSMKLLPRVTHAFDSANSPCGLRNLQRNCFDW